MCTTFYAGDTIECKGSEKCQMICRGKENLKCKVDCKCPQKPKAKENTCAGGEECDTVCRQSILCQTRCSGRPCATAGPFAACKGRKPRCAGRQKSKKKKKSVRRPGRISAGASSVETACYHVPAVSIVSRTERVCSATTSCPRVRIARLLSMRCSSNTGTHL